MTKLFNLIAGLGAIAVGVIGANPLWILILTLFNLFGTFLNPALYFKMKRRIHNRELKEVLSSLLWTYIFGVFLVSLYYVFGRLVGWLIN